MSLAWGFEGMGLVALEFGARSGLVGIDGGSQVLVPHDLLNASQSCMKGSLPTELLGPQCEGCLAKDRGASISTSRLYAITRNPV